MPKTKSPAGQRPGTETQAADDQLVKVLEQTVETEVLKRIGEPLRAVVHEAVREAIVAASHIEAPAAQASAEEKSFAPASEARDPHRPRAGGRCAAVWDELDRISGSKGVPSLKQILSVGKRRRWNENNTRVEYYQWCKFNGIQGRLSAAA